MAKERAFQQAEIERHKENRRRKKAGLAPLKSKLRRPHSISGPSGNPAGADWTSWHGRRGSMADNDLKDDEGLFGKKKQGGRMASVSESDEIRDDEEAAWHDLQAREAAEKERMQNVVAQRASARHSTRSKRKSKGKKKKKHKGTEHKNRAKSHAHHLNRHMQKKHTTKERKKKHKRGTI